MFSGVFINDSVIKLIIFISIYLIVKKLFNLIRFLNHYCYFPRDTNCSFLFGDLIKFFPDYWNTSLETYQGSSTSYFTRTGADHQSKLGLYVIWVSWEPLVTLCDHRSIETIMGLNTVHKPSFYQFFGLGEGLVTSNGDKWKMRRRMIEPFFVSKQQKLFVFIIDRVFNSLVNSNELLESQGKPVNLRSQIHESTCDIIFEMTLKMPIESMKSEKLHVMESIEILEIVAMRRIFNPVLWINPIFFSTKLGRANRRSIAKTYEIFDAAIEKIIGQNDIVNNNQLNQTNQDGKWTGPTKSSDFVNMLLESNKGTIDLKGISEELFTIIAAGHETTSTALNWSLFILGNRFDIQDKLYQEIESVFGNTEAVNDLDKISQCVYLDQVIKESMRLYPPIPLIARELNEEAQINGHRILKGTSIICNIFSAHRNPQVYPNPLNFDPERFSPSNMTKIPKGAYLPFGVLPRNCIGYRFALLEMKIFLIHFLRKFRIVSVKNLEEISYIIEFTMKPSHPLEFILQTRPLDS